MPTHDYIEHVPETFRPLTEETRQVEYKQADREDVHIAEMFSKAMGAVPKRKGVTQRHQMEKRDVQLEMESAANAYREEAANTYWNGRNVSLSGDDVALDGDDKEYLMVKATGMSWAAMQNAVLRGEQFDEQALRQAGGQDRNMVANQEDSYLGAKWKHTIDRNRDEFRTQIGSYVPQGASMDRVEDNARAIYGAIAQEGKLPGRFDRQLLTNEARDAYQGGRLERLVNQPN